MRKTSGAGLIKYLYRSPIPLWLILDRFEISARRPFSPNSDRRADVGYRRLRANSCFWLSCLLVRLLPVRRLAQPVHPGDADGGKNECDVDQDLPQHAGFGVAGASGAEVPGLDEGAQQRDRGDADDGHRQLDLERAGVDVA